MAFSIKSPDQLNFLVALAFPSLGRDTLKAVHGGSQNLIDAIMQIARDSLPLLFLRVDNAA